MDRLHAANRVEVYCVVIDKPEEHIYTLVTVKTNLTEELNIALDKVIEQARVLCVEKLVVARADRGI